MGPFLAAILAINNSFLISTQRLRLDYREPAGGAIADKYYDTERGTLSTGGYRVTASLMRDVGELRHVHVLGSFSRAYGYVPYDGHAYIGPTSLVVPLRNTSHARIDDWRLRVGKGFEFGERWLFTPYLAWGYHAWDRTLAAGTPGEFWEYYNHHTVQFGNRLQWAAGRRTVLSMDGRFGMTLRPHIRVPGYRLSRPLGHGPAIDLEVEADQNLGRRVHLVLGAAYSHFSYGQSGVQNGLLEPGSSTDILTWQAGLRYSFQ